MFRSVGFQLVSKLSKDGEVIGDCSGLVNMEELVDQRLVLITIKAIEQQGTELMPGVLGDLGLNGLVPKGGCAIKMHL